MTIGERIKQRRIELGLSQDELARKMGYQTRNAIYQFEQRDNMKLSLIEKFAEVLETTPAYLMGWQDIGEELARQTKRLNDLVSRLSKSLARVDTKNLEELEDALLTISDNPNEVKEFLQFYKAFKGASQHQRAAILSLLESSQSDP